MDSIKPEDRPKKDGDQWDTYIYDILLTYNNGLVHSSTGMTPKNAAKVSDSIDVKTRLELRAKTNRRYPELKVGDKVQIRRKKATGETERFSPWGTCIIVS